MAFGDQLGTLTGNGNSVTNPSDLTSAGVTVAVNDLIVVIFGQQTNLTAGTVTDNLGNTYTAQNAGTDPGSPTARAYYSIVTAAGSLTTIHVAASASTNDYAGFAAAYAGPFSAIDNNPANITSDATSPFTCPATDVLAQPDELVVCWGAANQSTTWTATSPLLLSGEANNSTNVKVALGRKVVASNVTTSPEFAAGSNPTTCILGTMTFRKTITYTPATFPSTSVLDSGTGGDANPAGGNWTTPTYTGSGAIKRLSNQLAGAGASFNDAYWNPGTFNMTVGAEVYATVSTLPGASVIIYLDLLTSSLGSTPNGYEVILDPTASEIRIDKMTAGSASVIAAVTQAITAGDSYGLSSYNGVLTAWYKVGAGAWTAIATVSNSTYTGAANASLGIQATTGRVTNFGGGEVPTSLLINVTDTCAIQVSEMTTNVLSTFATDVVAVQASDSAPTVTAVISTADTCAVQITDTIPGPHAALASDTVSVQAVDAVLGPHVALVADTCTLQLSEDVLLTGTLSVSDTLPIQAIDVATVALSALFSVQVTDVLTIQASDASTILLPVLVKAADTVPIQASEAMASSSLVSATDTATLQLSEQQQSTLTTRASDACPIQATDDASVFVPAFAVDTCAIQANEGVPTIQTGSGVTPIAAADVCAMQASDATPSILVIISVADSLALVLQDAILPGPQLLTATDAVTLGMQDVFLPGPLALMVADACGVTADDLTHLLVKITTTDTLPSVLVDTALLLGAVTPYAVVDACVIGLTDTATVVATDRAHEYWGGGARLEPAMFLSPSSTRTEALPPDQSRAETW